MSVSRVAIVGLGGMFPSAPTPERLWENVLARVDTAREPPPGRWLLAPDAVYDPAVTRPDRVYSRRACFLDPFTLDPQGLDVDPALLAQLDGVFHLALHAGRQAWNAGVTRPLDRRRVGVILGSIALPTEKASALARHYLGRTFFEKRGVPCPVTPDPLPHPLNAHATGLPAGVLARALGLGGGSFTLDAACASSLYAIKLAVDELLSGRADAMLAGGLSRPDSLYTQMGFAQLRALSPTGRCSPFDARGDGLVVGEGAGVFLLKRLADAQRDGDRILGVIVGAGLSNDVGGGLLAPASEGQLRALRSAYEEAGWRPDDVDLIECHATGTPVGDAVELRSLETLWEGIRYRAGQCVIGSLKSTVGHLLTGAGAAALTKVLFALRDGVLPPTANFEQAPPGLNLDRSPFRVLRKPEPWARRDGASRRAAVSAFGFGGVNAHLLIEEPAGLPPSPRRELGVRGASQREERETVNKKEEIAIVALALRFGAAPSLEDVRRQLLGAPPPAPAVPRRWWGAPESDWFARAGNPRFTGRFLEEVAVAAERFRIPPREIEEMLPQQALMLQVASDALREAGLVDRPWPRAGVFVGLGLDLNTTNFHFRWSVMQQDPALADAAGPFLSANRTMGALASIAASRIAREFRLGGPSFTLSSQETSGLVALHLACEALRRGELDQAFVGAVDLAGDVRNVLTRNLGPDVPVGDGAVALVLKRLGDAVRDGDAVHAVIRGVGVAGAGVEAVRRAYLAAGVDPSAVGYVEVHGGAPDQDHIEREALERVFSGWRPAVGSVRANVGYTGAASGLASLAHACLCLREQVLPATHEDVAGALPGSRAPRPWLRDRETGPRHAAVNAVGLDGGCVHVVLREWESPIPGAYRPPVTAEEALFAVEGDDVPALLAGLEHLRSHIGGKACEMDALARIWWKMTGASRRRDSERAVALVARDREELVRLIDSAAVHLRQQPDQPLPGTAGGPLRERVFYSPTPLGLKGQIAFVYPGSGNDFAGMGRDLALRWPNVLRKQDAENRRLRSQYLPEKFWADPPPPVSVQERIFAQVALGSLVSDVMATFDVWPSAAVGYSLGESAALFALRAWPDRDRMLEAMNRSTLFVHDLTGRCDAARAAWGRSAGADVKWQTGVVERTPGEVRSALAGLERVYLQIINTPRECVVGGEPPAVEELVRRLGAVLVPVPETTTMHCEVVRVVADAYRELHHLPTTPPAGVRFYSAGLGRAYDLSPDAVADAILKQAEETIDFPAVVEAAYRDGVRLFLEMGPGSSCTRMIAAILGDRPHRARSACIPGPDGLSALWRCLALLVAERATVDLESVFGSEIQRAPAPAGRMVVVPVGGAAFAVRREGASRRVDPGGSEDGGDKPRRAPAPAFLSGPLAGTVALQEARCQAHGAYLRVSDALRQTFASTLAFQGRLFDAILQGGIAVPALPTIEQGVYTPCSPAAVLDRAKCLEFAIGSIASVLGPDFAEIDGHPTRVRLPDEPLMLVDRILAIEGEARSLTHGRVATEHDIHPDAWYLDGGRIPTCIAVEAGQADLFLSGYLGIDFRTRGLAVYRLLDAAVTFHRGLPGPGAVIHYDIHIDRFFRQGDTHLFRFRFVGTVNGEPLLTMTDGCAGFFTEAALAAGKGVIHTAFQRAARPGVCPDDADFLPPMQVESYDEQQIDALRHGDLAGCFGPRFAGLALREPMRLPGGKMRLVHRVTHLDPRGGRFGVGQIRGEADVHPDDWFLTCHFIDDQVMPGTLMYECCLHTLRIFLMRLGWVGEQAETVCEPIPGVTSRLKCRGQVIASTRTVTYEVTLKERGYRPEPYAIVDALMYADGKPVVDITDMSIRLSGLTREGIAKLWAVGPVCNRSGPPDRLQTGPTRGRPVLFDADRILAFAVGKPSEAFGEPYCLFDEGRTIARLPGPPYQFLDRIVAIDAEPWKMVAGGRIEAEYDVPADAWYFASERAAVMPFAVLLEVALQPCGWLAAYLGSALTSPTDLHFRNLGGTAELLRPATPVSGTIVTKVGITRVASSAGMIIQDFDFDLSDDAGPLYRGTTTFGFFSATALAQQVGLRDVRPQEPTAEERSCGQSFAYPRQPPYPDAMLGMIDQVELLSPKGGPAGLGLIQGSKVVRPEEWFFKAHFYQDPVCPGSLGLESFLQLVKIAAGQRWRLGSGTRFEANVGGKHRWIYRGQVVPGNRLVSVEAVVTGSDEERRELRADGLLAVDGLVIYRMNDFKVRAVEG